MIEYAFQVSSPSNIFLFHYNMVLSSGTYTSQITTTLGIASGAGELAANSKNLYTGTTPVTLTGANTDAYIAGSNGTVVSGNACNINGQGTVTGLSAGTYYVTIWAAATVQLLSTNSTANLVVLEIK